MKLTILGCYGPYPPPGGACSGYLLEEDGCRVLLDCGNGVLSRLRQYCEFWMLDAVLATHLHSDHVSDLHVMRYGLDYARTRGLRDGPLPLYAPPEPAADFARLPYKDVFRLEAPAVDRALQIGPFSFTFLETVHAVPCVAVRAASKRGVLVYSGDTEDFPGLLSFAAGADLFLCEANFQNEDMAAAPPNHLSAEQAGRIAAAAGVKKLILTHLHPERDPAVSVREAETHFRPVIAAREGKRHLIGETR